MNVAPERHRSSSDRSLTSLSPRHRRRSPEDPPDHLLIFDIETVPDHDLLPPDFAPDSFPKPAFHRVVCIGVAIARIELAANGSERYLFVDCRSLGRPGEDEPNLLIEFWRLFESERFRLVGWNSRSFDAPVIASRSLIHCVPYPALSRRGTRWDGYTRRYSPSWHCDVMDVLSGYGAAPRHGLDEISRAIGLPGKLGDSGGKVAALVASGQIDHVRRYCEADVMNTALVYMRWAHVTGLSDIADYDGSMQSVRNFLEGEVPRRPHFRPFLDDRDRQIPT